MGKTPSRDNPDYWNGSKTWVSIGDMNSSKTISSSKEQITNKAVRESGIKIVPKGCVIMSFKLSVGKVAIAATPLYTNEAIMSFKPKDGYNLLPDFIYYYLRGYKWDGVNRAAMGLTLNKATISQGRFSYPPIPEQERIVAELDLLSGIIEKQKSLLKELDTLAQSIFYNMFGNPVENEKGWEVRRLSELSSLIINGNTPKGGAEVYVDEGILFFRSQNVWRNRLDYEDIAHIDDKTNQSMKKSILHHNDILITKTGRINTENSSLGRAALFAGDTGTANINGHVYLVRLRGGINHDFVLRILISDAYRDYIRSVCVGGIDKRQINKEHVERFPIIYPPMVLQEEFAEKVQAIEQQKDTINRSIAESQKLFDYTMDKYFG